MRHFTGGRRWGVVLAATVTLAACGTSDPVAGDLGNRDPAPGQGNIFMSAMPPGANGNAAGGVGAPAGIPPSATVYPDHYNDQLALYANLAHARTPLQRGNCTPPASLAAHEPASDQACNYFKNAPIELPDAQAVSARTLSAPNGGSVTIRRDGWGVPYVDGSDRAAAQYGLGYAAAEDRLWLFDVLRYAGRGRASEYLGPSQTTYDLDLEFGSASAYSEAEIATVLSRAVEKVGEPYGSQFLNDTEMFVAGMNAFVDSLTGTNVSRIPPEYLTLGLAVGAELPKFPPAPFTVNDIVANAILIQSALGLGGGGEASNVRLLQALDAGIGGATRTLPVAACETWRDLRHANATDSYHTATGTFDTQSGFFSEACPLALAEGAVIWDAGSYRGLALVGTESAGLLVPDIPGILNDLQRILGGLLPGNALQMAQTARIPLRRTAEQTLLALNDAPGTALDALLASLGMPSSTSNWIAVNADQTQSGHPILVGGPQTGYFNPQLLWEAAVISRGGSAMDLAARGISTVNLPYIVIGHGLDFAWVPTSAGSDFTDTRVSKMCNLDGSPPSRDDGDGDGFPDADGYLFKGECKRFYTRVDTWTATPTVASIALGGGPTPETVSRYVIRTHYGPVFATATVSGEPVAISTQRSTFLADVDTAIPFGILTAQGVDMDHTRFKKLFNSMTATFNWLYVDEQDVAYIQSGLYPVRHPGHMPELPVWGDGRFEWQNDQQLPASFFTDFGGDGNAGADSWPSRNQPVAQDALGYFEWPGYLPLTDHVQDTNPPTGFLANWNNSGAFGWTAPDGDGSYGPTHRVLNLSKRLEAFRDTGRKHDLATMIEVAGDAAYTDTRGLDVLPLMLRVLASEPMTSEQEAVANLMQAWMDDGSGHWIDDTPGLGAMRRDRDRDGAYDYRSAVVLMDAWYQRMLPRVTVQLDQLVANGGTALQGRFDAPGAVGSAFQSGWFQHMKRMFGMALGDAVPPYRQLRCAGADGLPACRAAVTEALDLALTDLGGLAMMTQWDGSSLYGGDTVEAHDAVVHTNFGFLPIASIHWINRPTFHQAAEIQQSRDR